ncbi:unnamed protein product [Mesocestoides corti]|uniref:Uncharacterized protein n=1 Tax=Mesocestoides corti TaxID=53468 RepID=A0A0R3UR97_MESCO|nr:unnamed protein product [Mesocestoides corti]
MDDDRPSVDSWHCWSMHQFSLTPSQTWMRLMNKQLPCNQNLDTPRPPDTTSNPPPIHTCIRLQSTHQRHNSSDCKKDNNDENYYYHHLYYTCMQSYVGTIMRIQSKPVQCNELPNGAEAVVTGALEHSQGLNPPQEEVSVSDKNRREVL